MNIEDIQVGRRYWGRCDAGDNRVESVVAVDVSAEANRVILQWSWCQSVCSPDTLICEDTTDRRPWWQRWFGKPLPFDAGARQRMLRREWAGNSRSSSCYVGTD